MSCRIENCDDCMCGQADSNPSSYARNSFIFKQAGQILVFTHIMQVSHISTLGVDTSI